MKLPQLTAKITVTAEIKIFGKAKENPYDFILGRNFLQDIKLGIKKSTRTFAWDEIEIPMVLRGHWNKTSIGSFWKFNIENKNREQVTNYSQDARANVEILDANYIKPNIENVAKNNIISPYRKRPNSYLYSVQTSKPSKGKEVSRPIHPYLSN